MKSKPFKRLIVHAAALTPLPVTYVFEKMVHNFHCRWWYITDLPALIKKNGFTYGAGLGVKAGCTLVHCLKRNPQLRALVLDSREASISNARLTDQGNEARSRRIIKRFEARIRLYNDVFLFMPDQVADESLDFIFYERDELASGYIEPHLLLIRRWLPKLRNGGLFIGLDLQQCNLKQALRTKGYHLQACVINKRLSARLQSFRK